MKELLKWNQRSTQTIAIGPFMVLVLFLFINFAEIFIYALAFIALEPLKGNEVLYNGMSTGLGMISKVLAIILVIRLVLLPKSHYVFGEQRMPVFLYEIDKPFKQLGLKVILFILAIFVSYRLGYDSLLSELTVKQFGIDPALTEGFSKALSVPALGIISIVIAAPVLEEFIYRGILFSGLLKKGWSFLPSALLTSLLFAFIHLNWAQGINAFFIGMIAASLYYWTGDLRFPILFHLINNLCVVFWSALTDDFFQSLGLIPAVGLTIVGFSLLLFVLHRFKNACKKAALTNV